MKTIIKMYDISNESWLAKEEINNSIRIMEEEGYEVDRINFFENKGQEGWYDVIVVFRKENNNVTTKSVD